MLFRQRFLELTSLPPPHQPRTPPPDKALSVMKFEFAFVEGPSKRWSHTSQAQMFGRKFRLRLAQKPTRNCRKVDNILLFVIKTQMMEICARERIIKSPERVLIKITKSPAPRGGRAKGRGGGTFYEKISRRFEKDGGRGEGEGVRSPYTSAWNTLSTNCWQCCSAVGPPGTVAKHPSKPPPP